MLTNPPHIAIMSATASEMKPVEDALENAESQIIAHGYYATGTLHGRPVVISDTGGGKVRAATGLKMLLEHFKPQAVLYIGVAGGLAADLHWGDVVIAEKLAYHDFGKLGEDGFAPFPSINARTMPIVAINPVVMKAATALVEFALTLAQTEEIGWRRHTAQERIQIKRATVVTGDTVIYAKAKLAELRNQYAADIADMESAVVAELGTEYNIPWLVIRGISTSDGTGKNLEMAVEIAAYNAAALAMKIVEKWDDFQLCL